VEIYPQSVLTVPPDIPVKIIGSIWRGFLISVIGGLAKLASLSNKLIANPKGTIVNGLKVFMLFLHPFRLIT
jgi:hypothetical protein